MNQSHLSSQQAPSVSPRSSLRTSTSSRRLIFLAEDNDELRRLFSEALRDAGYDVISASTGHEMLELLAATAREEVAIPDALVMDVHMPKCNGIDVLTALRLADWTQPVVMLTAFGDRGMHERATQRGASVSLDKPIAVDDLVEIVDLLVARYCKPRSWFALDGELDTEEEPEPETVRSPTSQLSVADAPIHVL